MRYWAQVSLSAVIGAVAAFIAWLLAPIVVGVAVSPLAGIAAYTAPLFAFCAAFFLTLPKR